MRPHRDGSHNNTIDRVYSFESVQLTPPLVKLSTNIVHVKIRPGWPPLQTACADTELHDLDVDVAE